MTAALTKSVAGYFDFCVVFLVFSFLSLYVFGTFVVMLCECKP